MHKAQQNFESQMGGFQQQHRQEGEVTIEKPKHRKKGKENSPDGEYVDFEEIDE